MFKIGVIGYGGRMSSITELITASGKVEIAAITDIEENKEKVKERCEKFGVKDAKFYTDAEEMLKNEKLDGVCIGTRCSKHTDYAVLVSKYNLPMFLEKPVCISEEQLAQLEAICDKMSDKTVVSFPLRTCSLIKTVKEIIDSGKIGKIEHVQAYNNVFYGRCYYHTWYRNDAETGGLFLQKATHDLDYINCLLDGLKPVRLCAMESKQIFKGNKPAGLMCKDCEEAETCTESPENVKKLGESFAPGEYCCYAEDTGNHDSASILIEYDSGMHVAYTQNFIVRTEAAGKRGARLIGYKGTLEFDWVTSKIKVFRHLENVTEEYNLIDNGTHFGGDPELASNFVKILEGKDVSHSTLADGILSAKLCLAAKKSATEHIFCDIR